MVELQSHKKVSKILKYENVFFLHLKRRVVQHTVHN